MSQAFAISPALAFGLSLALWLTPKLAAGAGVCEFATPWGSVVSLASLDAGGGSRPRFAGLGQVEIDGRKYNLSYNPCSAIDCAMFQGGDAAVCAVDVASSVFNTVLGQQKGSRYEQSGNSVRLLYTTNGGSDYSTSVQVACDSRVSGEVDLLGFENSWTLRLRLRTQLACWPGWSVGDFLVFFFFLGLFLYCAVMLLVNAFYFKLTGLDLLPNRQFWANVCGLIVDGFKFSWQTATARCRSGQYTAI